MSNYPLLNIFWTMLEFFLWILWFFLLFRIIGDLFRSHDVSGWGKAGWMILVIVLPFLGVLIYVVVRGSGMAKRDAEQLQKSQDAFKAYVRDAAKDTTPTDQLSTLNDLHERGVLDDTEFQRAKEKLLT
jgi:type VI protein secretion system component VasK